MNTLHNKHLNSQAQLLVMNVLTYFERERDNHGALDPFESVLQRTSEACGIGLSSLRSIKKRVLEARKENKVPESPSKHRKCNKSKSSTIDGFVIDAVKRKIYEMYSKRLHVTVKSLRQEIVTAQIFNFSQSSLTRLLSAIGFSFKLNDGRRAVLEQEHIAAAQLKFLRAYETYKQLELYDPVFLDKTWIFSRGSVKKSWHDGSKLSVKRKPLGEGKRFIVVHAGNKTGFMPNAALLYSTKSPSADYHGDMNTALFTKCFEERLIPNLSEPSVIILDNAKYHSKLIEKVPNKSTTKAEIIDYFIKHNVSYGSHMLKRQLLSLIKEHPQPKIYEIDTLAEMYGHKVLRLPPYHCEFNPIELVWANCKEYYNKNVGRLNQLYNDTNVNLIWQESLQRIDGSYWQKCITHAEKCMMKWWAIEQQFDVVEPLIIKVGDTNSDSSGSDTDQSSGTE